jgi:hypothetical protein
MSEDQLLMPVRKADIKLYKPLTYEVYDAERNVLLKRGDTIVSERQVEELLAKGLFRERPMAAGGTNSQQEKKSSDGSGKPQSEMLYFEDMKLMPGDPVHLEALQEGPTERFLVHVIGVMKPKSFLVTAPVVDGKLIFIRDGQPFMVRAFSGLNVCAFKARLLKSQLQPYPYLHLSYPDSIQAMRIRKTMRAPAKIIVAVHESEEGRQSGSGKIIDLSVGGARMHSPTIIGYKDQIVWLSFKVLLGDMEEYVKTPAVIRTLGEEEDEQGKRMKVFGLQFGELTQSQRLIIMNLVYQHLLKDAA